MGLTAGPVPPRVAGGVKAGLLDLVDHAVEAGWSTRAAAGFLGLDEVRAGRWIVRRAAGQLADRPPGGHPLHGLLEAERAAIVALFEAWGEIDRSHRKLAHRGSRLGLVHVCESTVRRVLAAEDLVLPGQPAREPTPRTRWPDWLEWNPNRVWAYDFTHFTRARRAALAIIDVVSRKWIHTLVFAEESSVQVEVAFTAALAAEDLLEAADTRATAALRAALRDGDRHSRVGSLSAGRHLLVVSSRRKGRPDGEENVPDDRRGGDPAALACRAPEVGAVGQSRGSM